MSRALAYYSATGNTLFAAEHFKEGKLVNILDVIEGKDSLPDDTDTLVIFSPVYCLSVPRPVEVFIKEYLGKRDNSGLGYIAAVFTRAAKGRAAERIIERELEEAGLNLSYSASVRAPDYFLPFVVGKLSDEKNTALRNKMESRLEMIEEEIEGAKISLPPFSPLYRLFRKLSASLTKPRENRRLTVSDKCTRCSLCVRVCPAGNIRIGEKKAERGGRCVSCYACYMVCPERAVKYSKDKGQSSLFVDKEKLIRRP